ncbi:MAG TPA: helix-turn-helix domain-containing protein [Armatimonadota bacterium]|jgi:excisionase family DNA binding protein
MARFQGTLQDWRRYIDEKTQAVRDRQEGRSEPADADEASENAGPSPSRSRTASDDVEAILAKHRATVEEINRPAPETSPEQQMMEAAQAFARLPRHIQLLTRPAASEVAQNSYKSTFTETREELIQRLLDPQLTLEETSRILNVCPTTVRRYTNRGLLKQERTPGNHRRFRFSNVLEFLEKYGAPDA